MSRQTERFVTLVLLVSAIRADARPEAPETPPLPWMRAGVSLESDYLHRPFVLDDDRTVHSISIHGNGANGKVMLMLDPNQQKFNLFGDSVSRTEIALRMVEAKLSQVKTADPMKAGRRLYELQSDKFGGRLLLVVPATEKGQHQLVVRDKGGKHVEYVIPLRLQVINVQPCHPGCFPAGTTVETPAGPRPIETVKAGDVVQTLSADGKLVPMKVASVFVGQSLIVAIDTDGGVLRTTGKQPLFLTSGGVKSAIDLVAGDEMARWRDGRPQPVKVRGVEVKDTQPVPIFNLVLEEQGIFIANGYLVRSKPPAVR
jgi:hypothetical protein